MSRAWCGPLYPVAPGHVEQAVGWLDARWRGDVYLPEELFPLVSVA